MLRECCRRSIFYLLIRVIVLHVYEASRLISVSKDNNTIPFSVFFMCVLIR